MSARWMDDGRLEVDGRRYVVWSLPEDLLAIRRGGMWEYYRANLARPGEYTLAGSALVRGDGAVRVPTAEDVLGDLSPNQVATLSNTICGVREDVALLVERGLATFRREKTRNGREISFFDLTPAGEAVLAAFSRARGARPSRSRGR